MFLDDQFSDILKINLDNNRSAHSFSSFHGDAVPLKDEINNSSLSLPTPDALKLGVHLQNNREAGLIGWLLIWIAR